jgi:hypothetical protein
MHINQKRRSLEAPFVRLLANGWQPLPNADKSCLMKGWSTVLIDERQVRRWDRSTRWPAIGLRVKPPMLVIDCDVPDETLMQQVREMLGRVAPVVLDEGLERIGRPPKAAFFLRYDTGTDELLPFRHRATLRFTCDPADKDADTFRIEMFAGGGGAAQIGGFGSHSRHPDGSVALEYRWVGDSPLERRLDSLPVIRRKETFAILDGAEAIFRAAGMKVVQGTRASTGLGPPPSRFDLTDETVFEVAFQDGTFEVNLDELADMVRGAEKRGWPRVRVTGSFTNDPQSKGSLRGLVSMGRHGVTIFDTKEHITHRPAKADPSKKPLSPEFVAEMQAIFAAFGGKD